MLIRRCGARTLQPVVSVSCLDALFASESIPPAGAFADLEANGLIPVSSQGMVGGGAVPMVGVTPTTEAWRPRAPVGSTVTPGPGALFTPSPAPGTPAMGGSSNVSSAMEVCAMIR